MKKDQPVTELKNFDPNATEFEANGKIYRLEPKLSGPRWRAYEKIQIQVGYDGGFLGVYESLNKIIESLNKQNWVNAATIAQNKRDSIQTLDLRFEPVQELCALFLNTPDEDRRFITDEMIRAKINDWDTEGITQEYFFALAARIIPGFVVAYKEISRSISERNKKEQAQS